jgi:hypothetical protein
MPVFGTGGGGASGKALRFLLPAVLAAANAAGVDVAVATNEPEVRGCGVSGGAFRV